MLLVILGALVCWGIEQGKPETDNKDDLRGRKVSRVGVRSCRLDYQLRLGGAGQLRRDRVGLWALLRDESNFVAHKDPAITERAVMWIVPPRIQNHCIPLFTGFPVRLSFGASTTER